MFFQKDDLMEALKKESRRDLLREVLQPPSSYPDLPADFLQCIERISSEDLW